MKPPMTGKIHFWTWPEGPDNRLLPLRDRGLHGWSVPVRLHGGRLLTSLALTQRFPFTTNSLGVMYAGPKSSPGPSLEPGLARSLYVSGLQQP